MNNMTLEDKIAHFLNSTASNLVDQTENVVLNWLEENKNNYDLRDFSIKVISPMDKHGSEYYICIKGKPVYRLDVGVKYVK